MPGRFTGRLVSLRQRRPRSRLRGCLLWVLALIAVLILLSLLFGGFRKGTRTGGAAPLSPVAGFGPVGARSPVTAAVRSGQPRELAVVVY